MAFSITLKYRNYVPSASYNKLFFALKKRKKKEKGEKKE
jgi:hypothetical protein